MKGGLHHLTTSASKFCFILFNFPNDRTMEVPPFQRTGSIAFLALCCPQLPPVGHLYPLPVPRKPYSSANDRWPAIAVLFSFFYFKKAEVQKINRSGGFGHVFHALSFFVLSLPTW